MNKILLVVIGVLLVTLVVTGVYFVTKQLSNNNTSEPITAGSSNKSAEIAPSSAIQGYKEQSGPSVPAGPLDLNEDCIGGLLKEKDEKFCAVSKQSEGWERGAGVAEIYFDIPTSINEKKIISAKVDLNMICTSGLGLYSFTEFQQWIRFGKDLPTQAYKPDGSYGYLSCATAAERRTLSLPIEINDSKVGVRIVKEEASASALIDKATLNVIYSAE
jgi:hypothetical protein